MQINDKTHGISLPITTDMQKIKYLLKHNSKQYYSQADLKMVQKSILNY